MADVKAVKSGNWSDPTVWSTGALPANADNVYANTFTVTIDGNQTCAQVTNAAGGTVAATAGGGFVLNTGVTLTAAVNHGPVETHCVTCATGAGQTSSIVGNVTSGAYANAGVAAVYFTGLGTLNVTGNIVNGAGSSGLIQANGGTVNVTGDIGAATQTGGANGNAMQMLNNACVLNVTGNVRGSVGFALNVAGATSITVSGNVYGGASSNGISSAAVGCVFTVGGRVYGQQVTTANAGTYGISSTGANCTFNLNTVEGGFGTGVFITGGNTCSVSVNQVFGSSQSAYGGNYAINANCPGTVKGVGGVAIAAQYGYGINATGNAWTINGSVTGPTGGNGNGFTAATAGITHTITGNVTGGSGGSGYAVNANPGTVSITGNVTGGATGSAVALATGGVGSATITGNVTGGGGTAAFGVYHNGTATVTVYGDTTGGTVAGNSNAMGCYAVTTGPIVVWGSSYASAQGSPGMYVSGVNTSSFVQRAVGQNYPNSGINSACPSIYAASFAAAVTVDAVVYGTGGMHPCGNVRTFFRSGAQNYVQVEPSNQGTPLTLGMAVGMPSPADVRNGTSYNGGNSVGTLKVPPAASVAYGVPVDNTTGTAALSPAALLGSDLLSRLQQCATVQTTGDQIAALS